MGTLTDGTPKPLLQAGGKPLIVWQLEKLVAAGVTEIVINIAHLSHLIEEALGDGNAYGAAIKYSLETEALETAGGIAWALPFLGPDPFAVINADAFCELDFITLRDRQLSRDALAHLILVKNPAHHPSGDFGLSGDYVNSETSSRFTYSGIGVYRPEMFEGISRGAKVPLGPLLRRAAESARITGALYEGYWLDVGTPQRLKELQQHLDRPAL
jgi:MurNAc alpha-1-phosphate uridylyltransferase